MCIYLLNFCILSCLNISTINRNIHRKAPVLLIKLLKKRLNKSFFKARIHCETFLSEHFMKYSVRGIS